MTNELGNWRWALYGGTKRQTVLPSPECQPARKDTDQCWRTFNAERPRLGGAGWDDDILIQSS
jgi:hypothetical protein